MKLDKVAARLRPRTGWEAADLGTRLALHWWLPVYGSTAAVVIPVAVLAFLLFPGNIFAAFFVVWWLKPVYDRPPLYIISRALFGEIPTVKQALKPGNYLNGRTLGSLFTRFFDPARSFNLPVTELEGLRGSAASARRRTLGSAGEGSGIGITLVFPLLEATIATGCIFLIMLMDPYFAPFSSSDTGEHLLAYYFENYWVFVAWYVFYVLSVIFIEPVYVAAGFTQYIGRRTYLEAWDIEIAFRRLAQRLAKPAGHGKNTVLLLLLCAGLGGGLLPSTTQAASTKPREQLTAAQSKATIQRIMKTPEFKTTIEVKKVSSSGRMFDGRFSGVGDLMATLMQLLMWAILIAVIAYAAFYFSRLASLAGRRQVRRKKNTSPTNTLFGLDIRPDSLPDDIAATARTLWANGARTEAVSLLYRGALANLVNQDGLELADSATEGDCMRVVAAHASEAKSRYFSSLATNWQATAYAHRPPAAERFDELCSHWPRIFGSRQP